MSNENISSLDLESFQAIEKQTNFQISPCTTTFDFDDKNRFTPLHMTSGQKSHINAFLQQLPSAMAAGSMANAYTVSFPEGLPHTLTTLKQGGFGSMIKGENGHFVGSASFYEMGPQAAALGLFSAMSVATGQYFLTQINSELKMMNLKFDRILEFLYGDKKAELMAEVSFAHYAYENYSSIMSHDQHRISTLSNLQASKKIAMKDIEFYIGDLDSSVNAEAKNYAELESLAQKTFQIRDSLDLSIQLYIMSGMLEVSYAQNHDTAYLESVDQLASVYIAKCEKRMLSSLSVLNRRITEYKAKPLEKIDKSPLESRLSGMIDQLNSGEESDIQKAMHNILKQSMQKSEYYLREDGTLYTTV